MKLYCFKTDDPAVETDMTDRAAICGLREVTKDEIILAAEPTAAAAIVELVTRRGIMLALEQWTHEYGAALCPGGGYADSHGDGMRHAKAQVERILQGR